MQLKNVFRLAGIVFMSGLLISCEEEQAAAPPPPNVITMKVSKHDVPVYSEWVGQTRGSVNTEIRATGTGLSRRRPIPRGTAC